MSGYVDYLGITTLRRKYSGFLERVTENPTDGNILWVIGGAFVSTNTALSIMSHCPFSSKPLKSSCPKKKDQKLTRPKLPCKNVQDF